MSREILTCEHRYYRDGRTGSLVCRKCDYSKDTIEATVYTEGLKKRVAELEDEQEKLLCENEVQGQIVANIMSHHGVEAEMAAATKQAMELLHQNERLEAELDGAQKKLTKFALALDSWAEFAASQARGVAQLDEIREIQRDAHKVLSERRKKHEKNNNVPI